ncbi:MAG: hypothetical protein WAV38_25270 [Xanthobacteraceae bacterium]
MTDRGAEPNIPKLLARARISTSAAKSQGQRREFAVTDGTELAGHIIERTGNRFDVTAPDGDRNGTFKSLKVATAALVRVAGWQAILTAHVDPKCNLAAVANPPLCRRPDPGKALNVKAAKRLTCCPACVTAIRTAVPNNERRRTDRAAAS